MYIFIYTFLQHSLIYLIHHSTTGKTTLVKHILSSTQHNKRIAVIENEFGGGTTESNTNLIERLGLTVNDISTLSVETMIARDGTDGLLTNLSDFIELPNGCVSMVDTFCQF